MRAPSPVISSALCSALCLAALSGCGAVPSAAGLEASLRVAGAQFVPGPPPLAGAGPTVTGLAVERSVVRPSDVDFPVAGTLSEGATAVVIGLAGDAGSWVLAASVPDITAPRQPTWSALVSFAPSTRLGARDLFVQGVDAAGHAGPRSTQMLTVVGSAAPVGKLVVSLRWDSEADLDLHVVEPGGTEIWSRKAKGGVAADSDGTDGGVGAVGELDVDSNALCRIDGRRAENVVYASQAPSGAFTVRVDTWSLCGQAEANWTLDVVLDGASIGGASGMSSPASTRGPHGRGAGALATTFRVP